MMRTEETRPVRLSEYRPPDWLVETVDLDVKLHPTQTPVRATLKLKPNPAAGAPAPLHLDGDGLTLVALKLDGEPLAADRYVATPDGLTIAQPPRAAVHAGDRDPGRSVRQHPALRPLPFERHLLHAMRGRRLPPHHLFPRPAGRDGGLHHADRGRQSRGAGAARQRQPAPVAATCRAAGTSRSGTIRGRSPPICSPWSAASSATSRTASSPCPGARSRFASMSSPARRTALRLRHGFAQARHALGRGGVRPRIRSRRVHDRRRVRLQHGRDGEQGPQRLQRQVRAGLARDRDRQRLRQHRGDHRARVFPQLDRQPHHLPRLVPALPEGRADGLPRPGVHLRPALARGHADRRRARPARAPVRRGCGPARPSGAARALSRDQQLLHHDGLREGRRGGAHDCRRCSAAEAFRAGMDLYFERHDGEAATVEQFVQCFAEASGRDLSQFMRWYSQAGTPEVVASGHYDPRTRTYRLDLAQTVPPTPGQSDKEPMVIPLVTGLLGRDGRDLSAEGRAASRSSAVCWCSTGRRKASCSRMFPNGRCSRSTAASRRRSSFPPTSAPTTCA